MLTRKDLELCAAFAREAEDVRERIQRLRSLAESATSVMRDMPGGSALADKTGDGASSLADLERDAERRIEAYLGHVGAVEAEIEKLGDPQHRMLLRMRYVDGLTWDEVAEHVRYSRSQSIRLHDDAMIALGIECDAKDGTEWNGRPVI